MIQIRSLRVIFFQPHATVVSGYAFQEPKICILMPLIKLMVQVKFDFRANIGFLNGPSFRFRNFSVFFMVITFFVKCTSHFQNNPFSSYFGATWTRYRGATREACPSQVRPL